MSRRAVAHRISLTASLLYCALGCASPDGNALDSNDHSSALSHNGPAHQSSVYAPLKDALGNSVGRVMFAPTAGATFVWASLNFSSQTGMHGFHVHANDNPANGNGCIADPAQPPSSHFVSADGHYNPTGGMHGEHAGDMPALLFSDTGRAMLSFTTDRFTPSQIRGRAVIVHQLADNYGNVPVGTNTNQYTPNSPEATTLTANTGNAGARIACGIVR